jgi:hypothetical protein
VSGRLQLSGLLSKQQAVQGSMAVAPSASALLYSSKVACIACVQSRQQLLCLAGPPGCDNNSEFPKS